MWGKKKSLETFEQQINIIKVILNKDWLYARWIGAENMMNNEKSDIWHVKWGKLHNHYTEEMTSIENKILENKRIQDKKE